MTGRLAVTSDDPADDVNYSVDLKNLSFEGKQMRASYDVPSDPDSQVLLVASFDGTRAAGTWSIRPSGSAQDSMNGRWSVTRK